MTVARPSIVALMNRVLGETFGGESWSAWRTVLSVAFGLDLTSDQVTQFRELTGRQHAPTTPVSELWLLLGRRAGKSIVAALMAIYFACVREYRVTPGELLDIPLQPFPLVVEDQGSSRFRPCLGDGPGDTAFVRHSEHHTGFSCQRFRVAHDGRVSIFGSRVSSARRAPTSRVI